MRIARDKSGRLFLYYTKPKRRKDNWHKKGTPYLQLDKTLFPELKWEDDPVEVKLVPSTAEVIVVPSQEEIEAKAMKLATAMTDDSLWQNRIVGIVGAMIMWLKYHYKP